MSTKQPIPSRDALRALRNLAFSNPGALAGAAASACCLVLVQCETQRRIRLAERAVENKRLLHSVSNGKGRDRMGTMIAAAESGQSFLLDPAGASRRQQKRNFAAVATAVREPVTVEETVVTRDKEDDRHTPVVRGSRGKRQRGTMRQSEEHRADYEPESRHLLTWQPIDMAPSAQQNTRPAASNAPLSKADIVTNDLSPFAHIPVPRDDDLSQLQGTLKQLEGTLKLSRPFGGWLDDVQADLVDDSPVEDQTQNDHTDISGRQPNKLHEQIYQELAHEPPNVHAVELLWTSHKITKDFEISQLAKNYLEDFRLRHTSDPEKVVAETRKVIEGLQSHAKPIGEELLVPVIRAFSGLGYMSAAERATKALSKDFNIKLDSFAISQFVKGYAISRDWSKLDEQMRILHDSDWSRQKVIRFSMLVERALIEYTKDNSPEDVYDFLTYYMQGYGMVPISPISSTALQSFIRANRFDLAKKWVQERRRRFPDLITTSHTHRTAVQTALTWRETNASTENILQTCRALADGAVRDPFGPTLRGLTVEAVCRDIRQRCVTLLEVVERPDLISKLDQATTLPSMYEAAYAVVSRISKERASRAELMLGAIIKQMNAANELNMLFGGARPGLSYPILTPSSDFTAKFNHSKTGVQTNSSVLSRSILPQPDLVREAILTKYAESIEHNKSITAILRVVVQKLIRQYRAREAFDLMCELHASPLTKTRPFDSELYELWLNTALEIRSPKATRHICWAILEDPNEKLIITSLFRAIASLTIHKTHGELRYRSAKAGHVEEANYLLKRLNRRAWQSRPEHQENDPERGIWEWTTNWSTFTDPATRRDARGTAPVSETRPDQDDKSAIRSKIRERKSFPTPKSVMERPRQNANVGNKTFPNVKLKPRSKAQADEDETMTTWATLHSAVPEPKLLVQAGASRHHG